MRAGLGSEHMLINLGPQHPATHGVLRLVCELDGETVLKVIPHIGYLHSSFEKLGEYRTWNQVVPLTDRMDYLAPLIYNCAYVMAVEKLMGVEVTERCKVVRVILMEMDRIFSHLLWLGTTAIDLGAFTAFLYAFQQREKIYDLHEKLTGARITTSATRVGGMMADLPDGVDRSVKEFMSELPRTIDEVDTLLDQRHLPRAHAERGRDQRAEDAINYGFRGPTCARPASPTTSARTTRTTTTRRTTSRSRSASTATCYDRYLCRMEEMRQSVQILTRRSTGSPAAPSTCRTPTCPCRPKTAA